MRRIVAVPRAECICARVRASDGEPAAARRVARGRVQEEEEASGRGRERVAQKRRRGRGLSPPATISPLCRTPFFHPNKIN